MFSRVYNHARWLRSQGGGILPILTIAILVIFVSFAIALMDFKPQKDTLFAAGAAAEPETQASSGSKSANEFCKNQLGKVEDITKVQCSDKESGGDTLKGHCTKEGSCKVERICDKKGTCKAISEKSQAPCNPEMGGGACRKEWQDIISNYGKELDYYATEDVRAQLRGKAGSPLDLDETRYFLKFDYSYYNAFTGNEILRINDTLDGKTITLRGADGQETTVDRNTPIESLREWINEGDPRARYAALEDAYLGRNVDLSSLAKGIADNPELKSLTSQIDAQEQLRLLQNQDGLVKTSGIAQDISLNRLQEFRSMGAEAYNIPNYDQQLRDTTGNRMTFVPSPSLSSFTGFTQTDIQTAVGLGVADAKGGGTGATPNLLPMQDWADRADVWTRGLRETFNSAVFEKLPQNIYISLLGSNGNNLGITLDSSSLGSPFNFVNTLNISEAPERSNADVFFTGVHEVGHFLNNTRKNPMSLDPNFMGVNSDYWSTTLYGNNAPYTYTGWEKLESAPPGMLSIYSAKSESEHISNTLAEMASGDFKAAATKDTIYNQVVDEMGRWMNRISEGMDRAYFEQLKPAAERFNFQLDKIRARIRDLIR